MTAPGEAPAPAPGAAPGPAPDADTALFRHVLGHFCTGVVVLAGLGPSGPLGLTCQSFSSLSLEPPLVMFGVSRTSASWPGIRQAGALCVNVLAADQEELSRRMARSGTDKFAGVDWEPTPLGAPRLCGALAWLECTLHAEYPGGDHTLVVAEVQRLAAAPGTAPLLYYRGGYAGLNSPRRPELRMRQGDAGSPHGRAGGTR
ncbi:flavin reductase family protein [Streptomyces cyanogenus]|uniref:Flavin-dependent monooxygenase, reductase subunit HsaB n=1 Tax=Streptomyces cyanogenus TaxID=80860 RepID=A0ABX7TW26_STRCY|nr:flavin reductase family protein [Streptomyces cyanogenus]QTD99708.1 Flavin-dependent monooxygenase, reductase subunit HsaB [Streptomyces cyanogenus]